MNKYLSTIQNWGLYHSIERGNRMYEQNSDNLIEGYFR